MKFSLTHRVKVGDGEIVLSTPDALSWAKVCDVMSRAEDGNVYAVLAAQLELLCEVFVESTNLTVDDNGSEVALAASHLGRLPIGIITQLVTALTKAIGVDGDTHPK